VQTSKVLQDHINARTVIVWLPGMSVGIAVQGCMFLGAVGITMSILWFWPLEVERFKYCIGGFALGTLPNAIIFNALVRGIPSARMHMFVSSERVAILGRGGCVVLLLRASTQDVYGTS
jgi:hypothetical protein